MNVLQKMRLCLMLGLMPALVSGLVWAQDWDSVEIKATPVAGNIYMIEGRGGNIGVSVGDDGILIVDDQFAPLADRIRAALKELGEGRLRFVLNTHYHGDHTGGNPVFGPEATIIAHDNVRSRLERDEEPMEAIGLPVITFGDSLSVHFNGEEIRALHMPRGHTDGDSVIHFSGANVVHMGDDFFAGRFPYIDIDAGGSLQGAIEAVEQVIATMPADVKIIPGHGPLSGIDDLKAYLGMLTATSAHVRKKMNDGDLLEEIQSAGLPEQWDAWGTGFINADRWIATIHRSHGGGE